MSIMRIAIDGPASSGKSTVAKILADELNMIYVDTGAMYRALTYMALKNGVDITNQTELVDLIHSIKISFERTKGGQHVKVNGDYITEQIRRSDVTAAVSTVAAHPYVRNELVKQQRLMAADQSVVMDGRDIGTVVFPDAEVKIYLNASVEERAMRRHKENVEKGMESSLEELTKEIKERDHKDMTRKVSPLKQAEDAILVDTTSLSIKEVVGKIKDIIIKHEKYSN
ncbi:(d)CMP kinase [Lacticigenium naphthae]|uniref:(d)CMP kinase n=1 Tax=Lacticigenium naphthae TaxID=515351 RepID=UPI00041DE953|nr:(d)CMP kinase [Lacticigenium naphthae]